MLAAGVFPLPNVKLTWGNFDLFADKMTAEVNPHSECYEVTTGTPAAVLPGVLPGVSAGDHTQGARASAASLRDNLRLRN